MKLRLVAHALKPGWLVKKREREKKNHSFDLAHFIVIFKFKRMLEQKAILLDLNTFKIILSSVTRVCVCVRVSIWACFFFH